MPSGYAGEAFWLRFGFEYEAGTSGTGGWPALLVCCIRWALLMSGLLAERFLGPGNCTELCMPAAPGVNDGRLVEGALPGGP